MHYLRRHLAISSMFLMAIERYLWVDFSPVCHPPLHFAIYNIDKKEKANVHPDPARDENHLSPDLGKRGVQFITVPGDGSEVRVPHDLSLKRIFKYAEGLKKDDLQPGERYQVFANDGYIGTTWWCWGSLDDDLKEKKLCAWAKGSEFYNDVPKPSAEDIEKEGYVLGEDIETMWFEDQPEGGRFAESEFVA